MYIICIISYTCNCVRLCRLPLCFFVLHVFDCPLVFARVCTCTSHAYFHTHVNLYVYACVPLCVCFACLACPLVCACLHMYNICIISCACKLIRICMLPVASCCMLSLSSFCFSFVLRVFAHAQQMHCCVCVA